MSRVRCGCLNKRATNLFWCFHEKPFQNRVRLKVYSFEIKIIFLCTYIIMCKVIQHTQMYSSYCSPFHTYISTTFSHRVQCGFPLSFNPQCPKNGGSSLGTVLLPIRILPYSLLSLHAVEVLRV